MERYCERVWGVHGSTESDLSLNGVCAQLTHGTLMDHPSTSNISSGSSSNSSSSSISSSSSS